MPDGCYAHGLPTHLTPGVVDVYLLLCRLLFCPAHHEQQPFQAKPVPVHVHERRYEATAVGLEAARLAAKVRADMARERAATKLQDAYKKR